MDVVPNKDIVEVGGESFPLYYLTVNMFCTVGVVYHVTVCQLHKHVIATFRSNMPTCSGLLPVCTDQCICLLVQCPALMQVCIRSRLDRSVTTTFRYDDVVSWLFKVYTPVYTVT